LNVYYRRISPPCEVRYYTIRLEGQEDSETDQFINRFIASSEFRDELGIIRYWLEEIGTHVERFRLMPMTYFEPKRVLSGRYRLPLNLATAFDYTG
jgi:hypothetical protein